MFIISDVVFDPSLYDPLLRTIRASLAYTGPIPLALAGPMPESDAEPIAVPIPGARARQALLAVTVRNEAALDCFLAKLGEVDAKLK